MYRTILCLFCIVCVVNSVLVSFLYTSVIPKEFQCTCTGQQDKSRKKSKEVEEPIVSDPEEGEETQAESSMTNRGEDDLHSLIQYILQQDDKRELREQEERGEKAARLEREERELRDWLGRENGC